MRRSNNSVSSTTPSSEADEREGTVAVKRASHFTLEEALECQVCLDVAVSPIYSCEEEGHILCSLCHDKLVGHTKQCPSCESESLIVSAVTERMAKRLEHRLKCENASAGCKEEVLTTDFRQHLKTCFFRNVSCHACKETVKFNEYMDHLCEAHNSRIKRNGEVTSTSMIAYKVWTFHSVMYDEKLFRLRRHLTESTFYIWAVILGDEMDAKQYFASISLYGKNKLPGNQAAASWTLPVIPFHEDPATEREKTRPVFGSMERKLFEGTVDRENDRYKFSIQVTITKVPDCESD